MSYAAKHTAGNARHEQPRKPRRQRSRRRRIITRTLIILAVILGILIVIGSLGPQPCNCRATRSAPRSPVAQAPYELRPPAAPHPAPAVAHYTVRNGDTLTSIAAQYHLTWQVLYQANVSVIGSNPNLIYTCQILVIP